MEEEMNQSAERKKNENYERELAYQAKQMTNSELKEALLEVRKKNIHNKTSLLNKSKENFEESLIREGVFSRELKNRELLEWALINNGKSKRNIKKKNL